MELTSRKDPPLLVLSRPPRLRSSRRKGSHGGDGRTARQQAESAPGCGQTSARAARLRCPRRGRSVRATQTAVYPESPNANFPSKSHFGHALRVRATTPPLAAVRPGPQSGRRTALPNRTTARSSTGLPRGSSGNRPSDEVGQHDGMIVAEHRIANGGFDTNACRRPGHERSAEPWEHAPGGQVAATPPPAAPAAELSPVAAPSPASGTCRYKTACSQ